jgi:hypothetical protein
MSIGQNCVCLRQTICALGRSVAWPMEDNEISLVKNRIQIPSIEQRK